MSQFEQMMQPVRNRKKQDLVWRVSHLSFLRVIVKPYLATIDKPTDLFSVIDRMLSTWGMFRKVLATILFTNLVSAKPIMKVI
jgi:hypothetical protein